MLSLGSTQFLVYCAMLLCALIFHATDVPTRAFADAKARLEHHVGCYIVREGEGVFTPLSKHCKIESVATLSEPICEPALMKLNELWSAAQRADSSVSDSRNASRIFSGSVLGDADNLPKVDLTWRPPSASSVVLPPSVIATMKSRGMPIPDSGAITHYTLAIEHRGDMSWESFNWELSYVPNTNEVTLRTLIGGTGQDCDKSNAGSRAIIKHRDEESPLRRTLAPFFQFVNDSCHPQSP